MCVTLKLKQIDFVPIAGGDGRPLGRHKFVVVGHVGWTTLACPVGWAFLDGCQFRFSVDVDSF